MLGTTERASASASAEFLKGAVGDFLCYYTLFPHCRPDRGAEDCYERVFLCVCMCVCLVRLHVFRTARPIFTKFFYACYLRPWLGPPLGRSDTLCTSGYMDGMTSCLLISQGCPTSPPIAHAVTVTVTVTVTGVRFVKKKRQLGFASGLLKTGFTCLSV